MLNITSQAGFSDIVTYLGHTQGFTVACMDIIPHPDSMIRNSTRSGLDYLWTGAKGYAGDHECDNVQISANVVIPYYVSGPSISTATDTILADSGGRTIIWSTPQDGCLFSYQQMQQYLGSDTTKELFSVKCLSPKLLSGSVLLGVDSNFFVRSHARRVGSLFYAWFEYTSCVRLQPGDISSAVLAQTFSLSCTRSSSGSDPSYSYGSSITVDCRGRLSSDPSNYSRLFHLSEKNGWTESTVGYCSLSSRYPVSLATYTDMYKSPVAWMNKIHPILPSTDPFFRLTKIPNSGTWSQASVIVSRSYSDTIVKDLVHLTKESPILGQSLGSPMESIDWGELCDSCIDNIMKGSTNWISNAKDFKSTGDTVRSVLDLIKSPKNPKTWADAFLSLNYGDRLLVLDTMESVQQIVYDSKATWSKPYQVAYATTTGTLSHPGNITSTYQAIVKIYYLPKSLGWFGDTYRFATKWGLWPSTQTAWNVIPFSFVVDWFVNVGNFLHDFDRSIYMEYITVLSVSRSVKQIFNFGDVSLGNYVLQGCTAKRYDRRLGKQLFTSPFRCDRGHLDTIDVVSGAALAAQIIL